MPPRFDASTMAEVPSDDDSLDPSEYQKRIDSFLAVAKGSNEAEAQMILQECDWKLDPALCKYFTQEAKDLGMDVVFSTKAPDTLTLLSWNIDGLEKKNLSARIDAVCNLIENAKPTIVFLQEVVSETVVVIREKLSRYVMLSKPSMRPLPTSDLTAYVHIFRYQCLCPKEGNDYFTATLLRRGSIYLDSFESIDFPTSKMGRDLLIVECHVGKTKLRLLNTHLESTADHASERLNQLTKAFRKVAKASDEETVIFGGDLNLRDTELSSLGGPPTGVADLWQEGGSRKECKFTWDMTRNTNIEFPGRFKPRCRFDRLYLRDSTPRRVKLVNFGLFGLEKVPGTQTFPSDHWGILTSFTVKGT